MTLEQLTRAIEQLLGLTCEVVTNKKYQETKLVFHGPKGIVLVEINVLEDGKDGWKFAGSSGFLPGNWGTLCGIHYPSKKASK